jgi:hypothetical protein
MVWRLLFGATYVFLGLMAVAGLSRLAEPQGSYVAMFFAPLLAVISVGGLALLLFMSSFARFRPAPVLGTAPSGTPAVFFRRSPFMTVVSVLFAVFLFGWLGALTIVLYGDGYAVWAALTAACTLALLYPLATVVSGRVRIGGLWLTPAGLEYCRESVGWTVAWSQLRGVDRSGAWVQQGVLPHAAGLGVAAVEPLVLDLQHDAPVLVRRSVRGVWYRECRVPAGKVCVDCFDLAGGRDVITEMIERYLAYPRSREQLGTEWSLPRRAM